MPVLDVPATAYEADALLGDRPRMRLAAPSTQLERYPHERDIRVTYRGCPLVTYHADGDISLTAHRRDLRPAAVARMACVLPPEWTIVQRGRRSRMYGSPRYSLYYRGQFLCTLGISVGNPYLKFTHDGGIHIGSDGYYSRWDLDRMWAEREDVELPPMREYYAPRPGERRPRGQRVQTYEALMAALASEDSACDPSDGSEHTFDAQCTCRTPALVSSGRIWSAPDPDPAAVERAREALRVWRRAQEETA